MCKITNFLSDIAPVKGFFSILSQLLDIYGIFKSFFRRTADAEQNAYIRSVDDT